MRSYKIMAFGEPLAEVVEETPTPTGAEVLLRVRACGVCHSDLHLWSGSFDLGDGKRIDVRDRGLVPPFTLGHEIVGEVAAVGPEATGVKVGQRRLAFPWIGCGACPRCRAGAENLCEAPRFLGTRRAGGYADHVLVPDAKYLLDPGDLPDELACLYTCSGITAYSALKKLPPLSADDRLLMVGAGGVGLMGIGIARALTPAAVVAADVEEPKRAAARAAGAAETVDAGDEEAARALVESSGGGAAAAVDFVGSPASARFALSALRRGGTLVVVGLYGGALSLSLPLLPFRSLTIRGSYVGTLDEMRALLNLVGRGAVAPVPVSRRPLDEATAALRDLAAGRVVGRNALVP